MAPLCGNEKRGRSAKMVFCLLFFSMPITLSVDKSRISDQTLEVQNQLNRLNKPAQISVESLDGDIIDCVNIKDQPAFDHPLLKNHTIETAPSFQTERLSFHVTKASLNIEPITQLWHLNGRCPEGTVPIRRTKEEDILRAGSFKSYGRKVDSSVYQLGSVNSKVMPQIGYARAIATMPKDTEEIYNGAKANINIWKPRVQRHGEFSSSQIWIRNGNEKIEAGWQVNPSLYGDSTPRLFNYWTNGNDQSTGCYNLLCSGFVQTDNKIALGATISPVSAYAGNQYEINISIRKHVVDGSWWMEFGDGHPIGYWPATLFTKLKGVASCIEWGGEVAFLTSNVTHTSTEMGSGHFPHEGPGKASFFRNMLYSAPNTLERLVEPKDIVTSTNESNCYGIQKGKSENWGTYFFYGGPGRNPGCQKSFK